MRSLYCLRALLALSLALSLPLGPPVASAEPQTSLDKTPSSFLPLVYSPQLNAQSSYHFEMKTTMEHDLSSVMSALMGSVAQQNPGVQLPQGPLAQKQSLEVVFSGRLNHRVIKKSSAGIVLSAQLSETSFSQNGVENDEPILFESPFLIKLTPQGLIKNVSFLPEVPEANRHLIKSLVEQTQLSLNGEFNIDWRSREVIDDTSYVTSYHREKDDFNKSVVRLTKRYSSPTLLNSNELAKLIPTIDEMTTTAEVAIDGSGLRSLSHTGALRYTHKGKLTVSGRSILTMDKMGEVNITLLDSEEALMSSEARKALKRISGYKIPRALLKQVAPLSVSQVVEAYTQIKDSDLREDKKHLQIHRLIKAYIVANPEQSGDLLDTALARTADSDIHFAIVRAFVDIPHADSQEAILRHLQGEDEEKLMMMAVQLFSSTEVNLTLLEAIWNLRNANFLSDRSALKHVLTNLFGGLGAVGANNPENTSFVVERLSTIIKSPRSVHDRFMGLSAIANIRDLSIILPLVEPFFTSEDITERIYAFTAFEFLSGEEAFDIFAQHFSRETSEKVLERATARAAHMPKSASRTTWARAQLMTSPFTKVKVTVAGILGTELKDNPDNEETLREALRIVKDRSVRREIYKFIGPNPK